MLNERYRKAYAFAFLLSCLPIYYLDPMCIPSAFKDETSPSEQPREEPVGEARSPSRQSEDAALPPEEEVGIKDTPEQTDETLEGEEGEPQVEKEGKRPCIL